MAPAQSRAVRKMAGALLLYAPVVQHDQIDASIAYLARRLDENTAPENFLRALFTITPGSAEFAAQADRFRRSVADAAPRSPPAPSPTAATPHGTTFTNEPDSDPTDPADVGALHAAVRTRRIDRDTDAHRQHRRDRRDRRHRGRRAAAAGSGAACDTTAGACRRCRGAPARTIRHASR